MPFVYLDTDQVFLDTEEVIIGDDPEPLGPVGFEVYRNGDLQDILWSRHQLLSITLGIVAYDGEIGTGSITLPGKPDRSSGWWIGDRITFKDPESGHILYTGYLTSPRVNINIDSLDELETTWTLLDMNRQFIGIIQEDVTENGPFNDDAIILHIVDIIEGAGSPKPTVDQTWVGTSGVSFPTTTWNSDGAVDMITQLIQYTGWTVYLAVTDTENTFELHYHDLVDGPTSGIVITDAVGMAGGDTFAPSLNSVLAYDTTDLKDGVTGRNGVVSVPGAVAGLYTDGGIGWEATLDYGSLSEDDLVLATNTVILTGSVPKVTFNTTIGPLIGSQVADIKPGSMVALGLTLGAVAPNNRVSRQTLTVSRDSGGNPLKGLWDVALEIGYPLRGPTATIGFGGQGNAAGALSTFTQWTHTLVLEGDPGIDVGESEAVTAQLQDEFDAAVNVPDVSLTWSVVIDEFDNPHPDFTVDFATTVTNAVGQATNSVNRIANTTFSGHRVKATPT